MVVLADNFEYMVRVLNTNLNGKTKVAFALTGIKGVGRRFAHLVCKAADVDTDKRCGELSSEEIDRLLTVINNPTEYKFPAWFMNMQRDPITGETGQLVSSDVVSHLRTAIQFQKKIRTNRGFRHHWRVKVRGQRTKATGRRGNVVGYAK
ncbi:hypothetical protein PCE1_001080 [Barthelona sp. PCE]